MKKITRKSKIDKIHVRTYDNTEPIPGTQYRRQNYNKPSVLQCVR